MKLIYKTFKSERADLFENELDQCIENLENYLSDLSLETPVVRLNIFIAGVNTQAFFEKKEKINLALEYFKPFQFIYEIVPQKPSDRQIAFKTMCLDFKGENYSKEIVENAAFRSIKINLGETFILLTTTSSYLGKTNIDSVFCLENTIKHLQVHHLDFGNVLRQWNFIGDILNEKTAKEGITQNYQEFNDVRSVFYKSSNFLNGYPSATGIGMDMPGIIIQTIAISSMPSVKIVAIDNPRQIAAHQYSDEVLIGDSCDCQKTTPKFERAKAVLSESGDWIFVSGTAAIEGEINIEKQDIEAQTKQTLELIGRLVSHDNLERHNIALEGKKLMPATFRAYVKNDLNGLWVKNACTEYFGNIPGLVFKADICRGALLVEIECEYALLKC